MNEKLPNDHCSCLSKMDPPFNFHSRLADDPHHYKFAGMWIVLDLSFQHHFLLPDDDIQAQ